MQYLYYEREKSSRMSKTHAESTFVSRSLSVILIVIDRELFI